MCSIFHSPRCTRRRIPARGIRLFPKTRAGHVRLRQIHGIFNCHRHHEVNIAVGFRDSIEIFGHYGFCAVWDSVLAKVAGPQSCRDGLHSPALGPDLSPEAAVKSFGRQSESGVEFPRCFGNPLPRSALSLRSAKVEQPRLHAGIGFQLERLVILPSNM